MFPRAAVRSLDQSQGRHSLCRRHARLPQRIHQHRTGTFEGFTRRYRLHRLVYVEPHRTMPLAIAREKRLKSWNRAWKVRLINQDNPNWDDLYNRLLV